MEKEHQILAYIQQQENASQREIARGTGMGLGTVNLLLKRLIEKGLVKIERLNSRSLRYLLTPRGFKAKTEKTLQYIQRSYHQITRVTRVVETILQSTDLQPASVIYLYGTQDEMYEIIMSVLRKQPGLTVKYLGDGVFPAEAPGGTVLVWGLEEEERVPQGYTVVNVVRAL